MKTLSENSVIRTQLAKIAFGAPIRHAGLTVVPLIALNMDVPNWLLLEEALLAGCVDITEISSAASVSMLRLTNHGNRAVLLLDGEELVGAKQNRVLNTTIIAAGHQTVEIPVSCVEQGRWAYRSKTFRSSGRSLYASVRRQKLEDVHYSLLRLRRMCQTKARSGASSRIGRPSLRFRARLARWAMCSTATARRWPSAVQFSRHSPGKSGRWSTSVASGRGWRFSRVLEFSQTLGRDCYRGT